jgi:ubiquinone/menaquinone biosynthesis C-methylase UbiE
MTADVYQALRQRAKKLIVRCPWLAARLLASSQYKIIGANEVRDNNVSARNGWSHALTAKRQERAYDTLLSKMYAGHARIDLQVAAEAVSAAGLAQPRLLEIGCGSGYYSEIFSHFLNGKVSYTGIDQSPAMIERARGRYPRLRFEVCDAVALPFPDKTFDIAFDGVSLMHIVNYEKAIAECRRVASVACIFHSVPIFKNRATTYFQKNAYGALVTETVFNRSSLLESFRRNGLHVVRYWDSIGYDLVHVAGEPSHCETFLCALR